VNTKRYQTLQFEVLKFNFSKWLTSFSVMTFHLTGLYLYF